MPEAIALNSASINATRIFGPALAGVIIGIVGTGIAFVSHSLAVLVFVITIFSLRAMVPHARPVGPSVSGVTALRDGLRYIRHSDELIGLVGITAIFSFLAVPSLLVLLPLYVTRVLGGSDSWVPAMTSCFGTGSLIAAIVLFRGSWLEAAAGKRLKYTMAGLSIGLLWLALAPNPWMAIPGVLIAGCSFEMGLIQIQTRVQQLAPDELGGRVLSVNGLAFNGVMPFSTVEYLDRRPGIRLAGGDGHLRRPAGDSLVRDLATLHMEGFPPGRHRAVCRALTDSARTLRQEAGGRRQVQGGRDTDVSGTRQHGGDCDRSDPPSFPGRHPYHG